MSLPVLPTIHAAKRRALRRRSSAGGTMFVVAMTLAVLSTIGAWAMQSAALEVRMAGFERQNTQTHYLAEYGVLAALQDVTPASAQLVLGAAKCGVNGKRSACPTALPCFDFTQTPPAYTCGTAVPWPTTTPATPYPYGCFRWEGAAATTVNYTAIPTLDPAVGGPAGTPGSLGATYTQGDFSADLSDLAEAPVPAGFSGTGGAGDMMFYWATITSYGKTSQATAGTNTAALYGGEGDEQLRARLLIGPIPKLNIGACK